jgi:hypothetical protein
MLLVMVTTSGQQFAHGRLFARYEAGCCARCSVCAADYCAEHSGRRIRSQHGSLHWCLGAYCNERTHSQSWRVAAVPEASAPGG